MDFTASVFTKFSAYQLYVKIQLEDVRFTQIGCHVQTMGRNSRMLLSSCPAVYFHENHAKSPFVKNCNTEFHENPTIG